MRKYLFPFAAVVAIVACVVMAQPFEVGLEYTSDVTTNTAQPSANTVAKGPVYGYIEDVEIVSKYIAAQTCAVVIVTVTNFPQQTPVIIYSNTAVTSGGRYRVRVPVNYVTGGQLGDSNSYERIFLAGERIKAYYYGSTATNNCSFSSVRVRVCP